MLGFHTYYVHGFNLFAKIIDNLNKKQIDFKHVI
jgi:hypothetical protein